MQCTGWHQLEHQVGVLTNVGDVLSSAERGDESLVALLVERQARSKLTAAKVAMRAVSVIAIQLR
jgi:hypothetical protein